MEIKAVLKPVTDICGKAVAKARPIVRKVSPYAPTIMMASGVGCIGVGAVNACVKTYKKLPLEVHGLLMRNEDIHDEHDAEDDPELKRELTKSYLQFAGDMAKLYAVPASLIGGGVALVIGAHVVEARRLSMAFAMYDSAMATFATYRERVRDDAGADKDMLYLHGTREETVVEAKEGKNGKVTEREKQVEVFGSGDGDDLYHKCFSMSTSSEWRNDPDYNLQFVRSVERICNQTLKVNGYLFLDEVYEMLGFSLDGYSNAKIVGWLDGEGDNFVDFRIYNPTAPWDERAVNKAVLNGTAAAYANEIYLDFNCDGVIIDKI